MRAEQEIEPVLIAFNGTTSDELWERLDNVPWLARDDDTYLLLAWLAEAASDERRAIIAMPRGSMLERHAHGERTPDPEGDDHGPGQELATELEELATTEGGVAATRAARLGQELLERDDGSLSTFWRVEVARAVAQCWLSQGAAADGLDALDRAEGLLSAVSGMAIPGSWQDATLEVTRAGVSVVRHESTAHNATLVGAADRLTAARSRVRQYRTADGPLLRAGQHQGASSGTGWRCRPAARGR